MLVKFPTLVANDRRLGDCHEMVSKKLPLSENLGHLRNWDIGRLEHRIDGQRSRAAHDVSSRTAVG